MSRTWQICSMGVKGSLGTPSHDSGVHFLNCAGMEAKCASSCWGKDERAFSVAVSIIFDYRDASRTAKILRKCFRHEHCSPVDLWAEDVMGFEEPGEEEESRHYAGTPVENE